MGHGTAMDGEAAPGSGRAGDGAAAATAKRIAMASTGEVGRAVYIGAVAVIGGTDWPRCARWRAPELCGNRARRFFQPALAAPVKRRAG